MNIEKIRTQTAQLNLVLRGCSSSTCPFRVGEGIGTANICQCKGNAGKLILSIGTMLVEK
jgi:hypothetical protein